MKYINFDESRKLDLVLLGRVAIDFNPAYSDDVKEEFKPLKKVHYFEKFVGGSPANIAVGVTHHGMKAGFIGKVSDDQFGEYVVDYFNEQGIDTSCISKCTNGEKLGLTFTEMLSPKESSILMYRNRIADLQLHVDDIDEEYIKSAKAILISGTALAESPSREAAIKAVMLAKKNDTKIIFDIDYREYNWKNSDEISIYYSIDNCLGNIQNVHLVIGQIGTYLCDDSNSIFSYHSNNCFFHNFLLVECFLCIFFCFIIRSELILMLFLFVQLEFQNHSTYTDCLPSSLPSIQSHKPAFHNCFPC